MGTIGDEGKIYAEYQRANRVILYTLWLSDPVLCKKSVEKFFSEPANQSQYSMSGINEILHAMSQPEKELESLTNFEHLVFSKLLR